MGEDQVVGREVQGPFDLFTFADELYIVYLRRISSDMRESLVLWYLSDSCSLHCAPGS